MVSTRARSSITRKERLPLIPGKSATNDCFMKPPFMVGDVVQIGGRILPSPEIGPKGTNARYYRNASDRTELLRDSGMVPSTLVLSTRYYDNASDQWPEGIGSRRYCGL